MLVWWLKGCSEVSKGFQLLEQTLVIIALSVLTLGLYDLARVMHVRSALNNSVHAALRCLYPSEGACTSAFRTEEMDKLYKIKIGENNTTEKSLENYYDYFAQIDWLNLPGLRFSNPKARVLDQVTYQVPQKGFQINQSKSVKYGRYEYRVELARLPYADTSTGPKSPRFVYKANKDLSYPLARLAQPNPVSISSISGSTQSSRTLGAVTFRVGKLGALPCFISRQRDVSGPNREHVPDFSRTCDRQDAEIVLHVRGKVPLRNSSIGQMLFKISQGDFISQELGGLKFWQTAGQSGNLVPRGLSASYYTSDHGYPEFYLHSPLRVRRGEDVTLTFRLNKLSGAAAESVAWTGYEVAVFTTDNSEPVVLEVPCGNQDSSSVCSAVHPITGQAVPESALVQISTRMQADIKDIGCYDDAQHAFDSMVLAGQTICSNCSIVQSSRLCPNLKITEHCPANFGVSEGSSSYMFEQSLQACHPTRNYVSASASWSKREIGLGLLKLEESVSSCSDLLRVSPHDSPTNIANYRDVIWQKQILPDFKRLYTGQLSARDYQLENSYLNCNSITIGHQLLDDSQVDTLPSIENSYFWGVHPASTLGCDWKGKLWNEAEMLGIDRQAYFVAGRRLVKQETRSEATQSCGGDDLISKTDELHEIFGLYSLPDAERLCAQLQDENCSYYPASSTASNSRERVLDLEKATNKYAFGSLSVSVPKARQKCDSENCVNFWIQPKSNSVRVAGRYKLPLLSLFGGQVELSYEAERPWE